MAFVLYNEWILGGIIVKNTISRILLTIILITLCFTAYNPRIIFAEDSRAIPLEEELMPEENRLEEAIPEVPASKDIIQKEEAKEPLKESITDEEALSLIKEAYFTSVYMFSRDVDYEDCIGDGLFCRPKDKNLTAEQIMNTLGKYYTKAFLENSNIQKQAIKVVEGKTYVMLLQGDFESVIDFQLVSRQSSKDGTPVHLTIRLVTDYDSIDSEITLVKEAGRYKVESGSIFPQL